jgi:hypothetical protein
MCEMRAYSTVEGYSRKKRCIPALGRIHVGHSTRGGTSKGTGDEGACKAYLLDSYIITPYPRYAASFADAPCTAHSGSPTLSRAICKSSSARDRHAICRFKAEVQSAG